MTKRCWLVLLFTMIPVCLLSCLAGREMMRVEIATRLTRAMSGFGGDASSVDSATPAAPQKELAKYTELETPYTLPSMEFTLHGFTEETVLTPNFESPEQAQEGTKFVIARLTVNNIGKEQFAFFSDSCFRLVDNQGRKYEKSHDHWQDDKKYLDGRELSPSIPKEGTIVYEVPADSTDYYLEEYRRR